MDTLSQQRRRELIAELCPRGGPGGPPVGRRARPCDSARRAQQEAVAILGPPDRVAVTADYVLMRAIDQYVAGRLTLEDLFRCRVLAYYITFAAGGEEWRRWGIAADVRPGDFPAPDPDPDE